MRKVSREEILTGNPIRIMFSLGLPVMLSQLMFTLYNMVDSFWLGHLPASESGSAVAGIQVAWPIVWFLVSFSAGFAMAGIALVSQYIGANDHKNANKSASQVISLSTIFGIVVGVFGYFVMPYIAPLMTSAKSVSSVAIQYMKIYFIGVPFIFISGAFQSILSAKGDNVTAMQVNLVANIINIVLDPILIFGLLRFPKMGVIGAALATVIAEAIAGVIAIYFLIKGSKGVKIEFKDLRIEFPWLKKIFRIGLPAAFGNSATSFGFVVLTGIVGRVQNPEAALAAYGVGDRLTHVIFIIVEGIGASIMTMIGQNLGANNIKRAEVIAKTGIRLMFFITIAEAFLVFLIKEPFFKMFIPNRPDVISQGVAFLKVFIFGLPFFGLFSAVGGVYRGSGHNMQPMIADIVRLWVLRLPLSFILSKNLGANGIWWGMSLSNIFSSLLLLFMYFRGDWKVAVIEKKEVVVPIEEVEGAKSISFHQ